MKFVATKKGLTTNFFLLFLDPGSGMGNNQDPGSGTNIPDPQHCFSRKNWKFDFTVFNNKLFHISDPNSQEARYEYWRIFVTIVCFLVYSLAVIGWNGPFHG